MLFQVSTAPEGSGSEISRSLDLIRYLQKLSDQVPSILKGLAIINMP
jgi:hypothetical protein